MMKDTPSVSSRLRRTLASPRRRYTGRKIVRSRSRPSTPPASRPSAIAGTTGTPASMANATTIAAMTAICPYARLSTPPNP
jgi:hypothetical protein